MVAIVWGLRQTQANIIHDQLLLVSDAKHINSNQQNPINLFQPLWLTLFCIQICLMQHISLPWCAAEMPPTFYCIHLTVHFSVLFNPCSCSAWNCTYHSLTQSGLYWVSGSLHVQTQNKLHWSERWAPIYPYNSNRVPLPTSGQKKSL